jgi:hypothetical protein
MLMLLFVRKLALKDQVIPNIASNTSALYCLTDLFLFNSSNHIAQRTTILFAINDLVLQVLATGQDLAFKIAVDNGSKSTLSVAK